MAAQIQNFGKFARHRKVRGFFCARTGAVGDRSGCRCYFFSGVAPACAKACAIVASKVAGLNGFTI